MIVVHHLENSRSQRVLWLLEELGLDYEVRRYDRDRKTRLAPKELLKVHPLGKSPVIVDDGRTIAETGAIIEHIVETHGGGRLAPPRGGPDYDRYRYWMHAAEGSYQPPLVFSLFLNGMETAPMPFFVRPIAKRLTNGMRENYLNHTIKALFDYLDAELGAREWLAGDEFSAADIIMSFPAETSLGRIDAASTTKNVKRFVEKIHARPAFQRALERGGPYAYA